PIIVGGRYGLGSKDTRPSQIIAVFNNLNSDNPKNNFTIGINDDVTFCSLPEPEMVTDSPKDTVSCKFWGLGSDGTVGANKSAIKIIGNNTDLHVQGYFSYDSKKSGGSTVSHLRFGKNPIKSHYLVYEADYIACHNKSFIFNLDVLAGIKRNGIFVLNCDWKEEELEKHLPNKMKKTLSEKNISFYTIDAITIAQEIGLGNRINMIMQSAFFKLVNIIPVEQAVSFLKDSIVKSYGKKGQKVVDINNQAVDIGINKLVKINVPDNWKNLSDENEEDDKEPSFINTIQRKMAKMEGDELPVSAFNGMEDGSFPLGVTAFEKRGIAVMIPEWQIDKCIECGQCSFVCPHATIRLFLLDEEEANKAPDTFKTRKATGKGAENYRMRVQVSPLDCTGCGNCADVCPVKEKAIIMKPAEQEIDAEFDNWEFAMTIKQKNEIFDKNTIKGSQFIRPLLEFNGACPGCGETPYIRLLTQLFGERMMIANATGCSSIWGASAPSIAYTTTAEGKGPSWANSLFEDNAEYGYGMYLGVKQIRERLADLMKTALTENIDDELKNAFTKWLDNMYKAKESKEASELIINLLKAKDYKNNPTLNEILKCKDYLIKRSVWMIGGDGWAYDIGYGGVDHVLASGEDINIFVMDTEIYSNTGGQASKATPTSAVAKFAATGKKTRKKDLGRMIMSYGNVYVAQIAMGANMNHTIKTMVEAENYNGPSLIIAYSPCISHGIKSGMGTSIAQEKKAVDAGYWHLYRYNPQLTEQDKNPFILDSKEPKASYADFIKSEVRYSQLSGIFPDTAEDMFQISEKHAKERYAAYKRYSENSVENKI
ncbi:MAG: pyruvate ferredoxin/flavodoxin oxidoreductase, partial [Clostridia bacterium]|nr:pyruvate ferredoxin/flavodoxin oxidoreductase [Clostridia bacterium]